MYDVIVCMQWFRWLALRKHSTSAILYTENVFSIRTKACRWHIYYVNIKIIISTDNIATDKYENSNNWIDRLSFQHFTLYNSIVFFSLFLFSVSHNVSSYDWHHVVFFYDRDGHYNVGGQHTCHLLMQTIAEMYRRQNITYSSFATDTAVGTNMTENLKREVGLDHASEYKSIEYNFSSHNFFPIQINKRYNLLLYCKCIALHSKLYEH